MSDFLETFTAPPGLDLSAHPSDTGGLWVPGTPGSVSPVITAAGRLRGAAPAGDTLWLSTATFAAPHTLVTADLYAADGFGPWAYVVARRDGGGGVAAGLRFAAEPQWELYVAGALVAGAAFTPTPGHTYALHLALTDTSADLYVGGGLTLSHAAAMPAGTGLGVSVAAVAGGLETSGWHLDNLTADGQTGAGSGGGTGGGTTPPARRRACGG